MNKWICFAYKGEKNLAEWLATLPVSIFVCDYDHNAPTVEHLQATHYPLYEVIRERNSSLPYIMLIQPNYWTALRNRESVLKRLDVVVAPYLKARQSGDENVYFIDRLSFLSGEPLYENTMDASYPNAAGFLRMAEGIVTVIRHILERETEKSLR